MHDCTVESPSALGGSGSQTPDSWRAEVDEIISRINAREREEWATLGLSSRSETLVLAEVSSGAPPSGNAAGCALSATEPAVVCGRCPNPLALEEAVTLPVHPATQASLRSACASLRDPFDLTLPSAPLARQPSAEGLADRGQARPVDDVAREVLDASDHVRAELGPALEPLAFRTFLAHELRLRGLLVVEDVAVAESYRGKVIDDAYRVDMLVEGAVLVDVGRTEGSHDELEARLRHLMTRTGARAAVLAPPRVRDGIGCC
jgi:GxxExxY protein